MKLKTLEVDLFTAIEIVDFSDICSCEGPNYLKLSPSYYCLHSIAAVPAQGATLFVLICCELKHRFMSVFSSGHIFVKWEE